MNCADLREIPVDAIRTPVQVRAVDDEHVERLAASMLTLGLQQPIVVHLAGTEGEGSADTDFVLGPGRHRLEAARRLKWPTIAAIVHPAAPEERILAEQARENLDRKDLTPLQEAELCADFIERFGGDVAHAATVLGRTKKWVELRAALIRLVPPVRQMVSEGLLPLGHAQLIARLPDRDAQLEVAQRARAHPTERYGDTRPAPIHHVKDWVDARGRDLSLATWDLDAVFGAAKRACSSCPHNTANQPGLFDGDAPKRPGCLSAPCYQDKLQLASRAARKSANYIRKEGLPASPASAIKARDAREVPFVSTRAVVDMVKHQAPGKKKARGSAIDGAMGAAAKPKTAQDLFENALEEWEQAAINGPLGRAVNQRPLVLALLHLLEHTELMRSVRWAKGPKADRKRQVVAELLAKADAIDGGVLVGVAKQVLTNKRSHCHELYEVPNEALIKLAEALKVELPPMPKREDFEAQVKRDVAVGKSAGKAAPAKPEKKPKVKRQRVVRKRGRKKAA